MRSGYDSSVGGYQTGGGYSSSQAGGGYSSSQGGGYVTQASVPSSYVMNPGTQQITYAQTPGTFFYRPNHHHHHHPGPVYYTSSYNTIPDEVACCTLL